MTSLSESAVGLGVLAGHSIGFSWFEFFSAPNGHLCGVFGGGGIGERVGRESGTNAGRWIGPTRTVVWDRE